MKINDIKVKRLPKTDIKNYHTDKQQVFCIGSKGIPACYGGYETFVEKLTAKRKSEKIRYHVSRIEKDSVRYMYNDAKCFDVNVPVKGSAKAIYYDIAALWHCINYCRARKIKNPVFYIMACRIGPFILPAKKAIDKMGGVLYINPDGHEWKRSKWSKPVRRYWKVSERLMVKNADLLVCDSKNIEKYILKEYGKYKPNTTYISYGADIKESKLSDTDEKFNNWLKANDLEKGKYYLIVGRFVPENNYETMLREFMKADTDKKLAVITTSDRRFKEELEEKTGFQNDNRIKFTGTVYDDELLTKIRECAYGYIHGHEVGGTNPSLLEALGSTKINLLFDVGFNREVAESAALYWNKDNDSLKKAIEKADLMDEAEVLKYGEKSKQRISDYYSWSYIVDQYESLFLGKKIKHKR